MKYLKLIVAAVALAVRHADCGAVNELAPNGMSGDCHELYKVVGEVQPMH